MYLTDPSLINGIEDTGLPSDLTRDSWGRGRPSDELHSTVTLTPARISAVDVVSFGLEGSSEGGNYLLIIC